MTNATLTKISQTLMGVEATLLPVFIHNPNSQAIAGVVLMAESAVLAAFATPAPAAATPAAAPAASKASGTSLA